MQVRAKQKVTDMEKIKEYVDEYMREQEDTNRRRNNVVIHNIPEPRGGSAKERLDKDKHVCTELFETSLRLEKDEVEITKVMRLGKTVQEGKNRPVLLVLRSKEEKREVLRRAKNLKDERDPIKKSFRISPDLTRQQREHDYNLSPKARTQGDRERLACI